MERRPLPTLMKALLWKSWCIRKRHFIMTILEMLFPIAMCSLVVVTSVVVPKDMSESHEGAVIPPVYTKRDILDNFHSVRFALVFWPNTTYTQQIMNKVKDQFESSNIVLDHYAAPSEASIGSILSSFNDSNYVENKYGIVFPNSEDPPLNFDYKLRSTNSYIWKTDELFPTFQTPGPMDIGEIYIAQGFLALQICLDDAYIEVVGGKPPERTMQYFPYPPYKKKFDYKQVFLEELPLFFACGFVLMSISLVKRVLDEKQTGATEYMKMVGLNSWLLGFSWIVFVMLAYTVACIGITVIFVLPFTNSDTGVQAALIEFSNPILLFVLFILFTIQLAAMFLAIAALFNNPNVGSTVATFFWISSFVLISYMSKDTSAKVFHYILLAMTPQGSILSAFRAIARYELSREGVQFSNLFHFLEGNNLSLLSLFICMICGTWVLIVLEFYISSIRPGKYRRAKPWYFIFEPLLSRFQTKEKKGQDDDHLFPTDISVSESVPNTVNVGLSVNELVRTYGSVVAVNKVSLKIYEGQITAILGHNGAGKTTLMSMITGLLNPSSGSVTVNNKDIFKEIESFQQNFGLCPQHNLLFPYLTASEHLIFFGMLKGLSMKEARLEATSLLEQMGINAKKNDLVPNLSGGMKRKVSLAVSLVGSPKILILDEPTSGMDPESRRNTWDLLLKLRGQRTIIITTHFMEEADAIGDRIAIMDHGEVKCYGTPLFLKKHYATGYKLSVVLSQEADKKAIASVVKSEIADMTIEGESSDQMNFTLPTNLTSHFVSLFSKLEASSNLGISAMGLTCTTMEDVFLKVAGDSVDSSRCGIEDSALKNLTQDGFGSREALSPSKVDGFELLKQQLGALLMKKAVWTFRHWKTSLSMIILKPAFLTLLMIYFTSIQGDDNTQPFEALLSSYGRTKVLVSGNTSMANAFQNLVTQNGSYLAAVPPGENIIDGLLNEGKNDEVFFRHAMIVAGEFSDSSNKILYSSIARHSIPIATNLFSNAYLKANSSLFNRRISVINHPIDLDTGTDSCSSASNLDEFMAFTWMFYLPMVLMFAVNGLITFPHQERTSSGKQLQIMTGLSPITYWFTHFIWDYGLFILSSITIFALLPFNVIPNFPNLVLLFFCVMLMGISTILLVYDVSFFFASQINATTFFYVFNTVFGCIASIITKLIEGFLGPSIDKGLLFVIRSFYINPFHTLAFCVLKVVRTTLEVKRCNDCQNSKVIEKMCTEVRNRSFFTWDRVTGINFELVFFAADILLYLVILLLLEMGVIGRIYNWIRTKIYLGSIECNYQLEDIDVAAERDRVDASQAHGSRTPLVVDGLAKKFSRSTAAVKKITFSAERGECFGLLGVNGAGKTTTFRMLTGDLLPTSGSARILGWDSISQKLKYLSNIGYCPQFDGICEELTGIQNLTMYAKLRGVHPSKVGNLVQNWITVLGIDEFRNKPSKTYSGGNKRKLSTAVALIGDSPLVLLDEPTCGVDPLARRKLWSVLSHSRKKGQTIVVTSHSMEECEAICDRLTIMVQGQLKCIGSVQHLKQVYGKGYTLLVKLGSHSPEELEALKGEINQIFHSHCTLKDEHITLLHYHLTDTSLKLSYLFREMESLKSSRPIVEEYAVSQTTLEQIFLSFAQQNS